jgi:DNA-binding NarL/FixJ family response regulator
MKPMIRVVIADDLPMFREGMHLLLDKQKELEITGEAGNGKELLDSVRQHRPDVVITDIEMPVMNGIEATKEIKKEFPETGVIALTMYGDDYLIEDMLEAGANGYLLKNTTSEELVTAVKTVHEGHPYFCNATSLRLSKLIAKNKILQDQKKADFSEKEIEIIQLICEQYASKEIADKTSLAHRTVEKYRDHIMQKTGSRNVVGIVIYAIKHGIYKP